MGNLLGKKPYFRKSSCWKKKILQKPYFHRNVQNNFLTLRLRDWPTFQGNDTKYVLRNNT